MSAAESSDRSFQADSLALGMSVMLVMTIIQRAIGFGRGIWFCRVLDDQVLGQWAMAFGFVTMVTPMLLLGLPGSLPRYVETYRQRGHLRSFLRRIAWLTFTLSGLAAAGMIAFPDAFGRLVFRAPAGFSPIMALAVALVSIVLFNSLNELVAALRQVRVVSWMQFTQSVGFTILAIAVLFGGGRLTALIYSFAAACWLGSLPAWWVLLRNWHLVPQASQPLCSGSMWQRVLPYAAALWVMNLLSNAFELSDRYMILHVSQSAELGQSLVGQYHSARIIPALLVSVAVMGSGVFLPYMTADWEGGRHRQVRSSLRRVLLAVSVVFTLGAAFALTVAPWMFESLLGGRYEDGLAVMPLAFTFSIWGGLIALAQNYLWVAERGKLVGWALAVGLAVNLGLNAWLLPRFGLGGAVAATAFSHLVVLLGIYLAMQHSGYRSDVTLVWVTLLPATLLAGPLAALVCTLGVCAFSSHARRWLREAATRASTNRHRRWLR